MKFRIKDNDGSEYTVEEMIEEKTTDDAEEMTALTEDEIRALKALAASASQILELLNVEKKEHEAVSDEEEMEEEKEEEVVEDEDEDEEEAILDEDEDEEKEEEILETKSYDSKKSFGSIERKTQKVDDSLTDSISEAWTKRYGGIK